MTVKAPTERNFRRTPAKGTRRRRFRPRLSWGVLRRLLSVLLTSQQPDGGWCDPTITAIAVRALLGDGGHGLAVERALGYLAKLQQEDGLWPGQPMLSAFILMQLGDRGAFRRAVQFGAAIAWFTTHRRSLDEQTRRLL